MSVWNIWKTHLKEAARENSEAIGLSLREVIVETVGLAKNSLSIEIDSARLAYVQDVLLGAESEGIDLQRTSDLYERRTQWAIEAPLVEQRTAHAAKLEREWDAADRAEAERHRAVMLGLERDAAARDAAARLAEDARGARSELWATGHVSDAEKSATQELAVANSEIKRLQQMLNPNRHPSTSGQFSAMLPGEPAAFASQVRAELGDKRASHSKEKVAQLREQLAAAERGTTECKKLLTAAEKRRAEINSRLENFTAEKLKPENFRFERARLTQDQAAKKLAIERGWGAAVGEFV